MDATLARQILTQAKDGGYLDRIPDDEDALIESGEYYLTEARKAFDSGMSADAIIRIIELGEASNGEPAPELVQEPPVQAEGSTLPDAAVIPAPAALPMGERLPVPSPIEGDPTDMPQDLTTLTDREVRKLHGEHGAFLSRAIWVVAMIMGDLSDAKHIRDAKYREAMLRLERVDAITEKPKLSKVLEAEVENTKEFREWDDKVRQHEIDLEKMKALKEVYAGNVSRLSREMSMRAQEYESTGR